jgi:exopolyphosphatase / guanosine-5'-triphosphate,3'-diphosphate pyrophosphatase
MVPLEALRQTGTGPAAVVDIGSNSVRLVAYEGLTRAPTPIFNEKVLAGLARNVATTGLLPTDGVKDALAALRRFRGLADVLKVQNLYALATAAARDAKNGPEFLEEARRILGCDIDLISGPREAHLSAHGVISGIHEPDGLAGDLGGGSLELVSIHGKRVGSGASLKLGGIALQDASGGSIKKAEKIVKEAFKPIRQFDAGQGRDFYAVGGTWRALAKLHMQSSGYPLQVMHGYAVLAAEMLEFSRMAQRVAATALPHIDQISSARRPLIAFGALLMEEIIRTAKPGRIVFSAFGVREGLLYELLSANEQQEDALLAGARELNLVRSRSPQHGEELCGWTDRLMRVLEVDETEDEIRLRHAACLLSDVGWRAHPDYRAELSYNMIAHAALAGVDHPGRVYMALSVYFRHMGLSDMELPVQARSIAPSRLLERAKILGAAMRIAYIMTAAMAGVLPAVVVERRGGKVFFGMPRQFENLVGDRIASRARTLSRLTGEDIVCKVID